MKKLTLASLLLTSLSAPMLTTAADVASAENMDATISKVLAQIETPAKTEADTAPVVASELAQTESIVEANTLPVVASELAQAEPMVQEDVPALTNTEKTITLASAPSTIDSAPVELSPAELVMQAIADDPANAQAIIAQALASSNSSDAMEALLSNILALSGDDATLVQLVASAMVEAGVNSDTLVALAVAQGIDATLVSEATAAGPELTGTEVAPVIAISISPRKTPNHPGNGGNGGISKNV